MIKINRSWMLLLAAVVSFCTVTGALAVDSRNRSSTWDPSALETIREGDDTVPIQFTEPTGDLTLQGALAAVLANNPQLAAFAWEIRAREAEIIQAGLLPNPELKTELENFGGGGDFGGFKSSETTISLSQLIELGGKRGKRYELATWDRDLATWDYRTVQADVLMSATRDFLAVLGAQDQLVLTEDLIEVAENVLVSVSRRVKAGATSPIEESRAKVELAMTRVDRERARSTLAAARTALAANWGNTAPVFTKAVGRLADIAPPPPLDDLKSRIERNPALARWAAELDRRRAALKLERSLRVPDLSVGVGARYFRDIGSAAFVVEFGLPLPLFDRNQGASRAAAMRLDRISDERRVAEVRIVSRLTLAHETLLAAVSEVTALRNRALPQAELAFQAAQGAYLRGSIRFIDVLDTERLLFELKSRHVAALVSYHVAVADIERLTGESLGAARDNSGSP